MEANFGGLMDFITIRFSPAAELTAEERTKLIQHLIHDAITRDTLRADQCINLSVYLHEACQHLANLSVSKRALGDCKYCGGDHVMDNCVHRRRAAQRGEMIR